MRPIRIYAVGFAIALLIFAVPALTPAAASAMSTDQAVAYQLDPAHDGFQTGDAITTPLAKVWSDSITGSISYPLIINGVVYVTVTTSSSFDLGGDRSGDGRDVVEPRPRGELRGARSCVRRGSGVHGQRQRGHDRV